MANRLANRKVGEKHRLRLSGNLSAKTAHFAGVLCSEIWALDFFRGMVRLWRVGPTVGSHEG